MRDLDILLATESYSVTVRLLFCALTGWSFPVISRSEICETQFFSLILMAFGIKS
jgi:hypothetical protein